MSVQESVALGESVSSRAQRFGRFLALLAVSLRAHGLFFGYVLAYLAAASVALVLLHGGFDLGHPFVKLLSFSAIPIILIVTLILRFLNLVVHVRPKHPTIALIRDLGAYFTCPRRMANGLPMLVMMLLFIQIFAIMKLAIPMMHPFSWDLRLMEFDRWLHFGVDPWRILQPVLGHPAVTFTINFLYNMWFFVMWSVWVWLAFSAENSLLRTRFFVAFVLSWSIGGTLLATVFSSAGPCYYGDIGLSPDPFAPLMDYLHKANARFPIWAVDTQQGLWKSYIGQVSDIGGISAMPSMHNATAVLMTLAGWQYNRRLGIGLGAFAAVILIGSVHLGWHYAVDGYFAILMAVALWWVAGPIARRYHGSDGMRRYHALMDEIKPLAA